MFGTLYIVATPIGNLQDITARAIQTLKSVDLIAAEDTRHSKHLLQHFGINTPLIALHEHNERERSATLIQRLQKGESIALISDAGTPLISDPGYYLTHIAHQHHIPIIPIPGACALITALSASGLPSDRFIFEGFLSAKQTLRRQQLSYLQHETRTLIFYEAPHRILHTIEDMLAIFGSEREAVLARELTKTFETILTGTLESLLATLQQNPVQQKGEFVILVKGAMPVINAEMDSETLRILEILLAELPAKQATHLAAQITGKKKNELYKLTIK